MKTFDIVQCITSGDGFEYGKTYAVLGWNNGLHVVREDLAGDVHECIVHNFGNILQEPNQDGPDFVYLSDIKENGEMEKIKISIEQYNTLFEKASSFDKLVRTVKRNIDNGELYPVHEDQIILLTGLADYQHQQVQAMANHAKESGMIAELLTPIKTEQKEELKAEERSNAENQTEL